jgi:hypothetical protein
MVTPDAISRAPDAQKRRAVIATSAVFAKAPHAVDCSGVGAGPLKEENPWDFSRGFDGLALARGA